MPKLYILIFIILSSTNYLNAFPLQEIDSLHIRLLIVEDEEKIETLLTLSEAYRNIVFNDCIKYGMQALRLADETNNKTLKALIFKSLGISCYYSGNMDIALGYYSQSLNVYKDIKDEKGQANCLNNIGLIYEEWADFDKATDYYSQSYKIEEMIGNKEGMAISLIQIGNISFYRNSFQEALDNYYRALLIFTEIEDAEGIAYAYNSIGIIYGKWNNFDKALEYYQKAKELYNETSNRRALSQVLTNMGEVYNFELKDYKTALCLYSEALMIKKSLEDVIGISLLYNNLGTLYANMEDKKKALEYFSLSLKSYEESGILTGVVMVNYNLGELYQDSDNTRIAIEFFKKSLLEAVQTGQVDYINSNYEALIHCYAMLGEYEEFEKYFRLFNIGKDSLINKLNNLKMIEVEAKYKVEESLRESEQLQLENIEKEKEIKKYKLLLAGIGGVFITLLFMYLLFLRLKKK